jgi:hypothetical protein
MMLKLIFRHAAPPTRARLLWLALPLACSWMVAGTATAAETAPSRQAVSDPFRHYQGWRDEPLQDWRAANARVGEIGGWRAYLRESQQDGDGADEGSRGHPGHHGEASP